MYIRLNWLFNFLVVCVAQGLGRFAPDDDVSMKVWHNYDLKSDEFTECGNYHFFFGNTDMKQQCLPLDIRTFIQEHAHLDDAFYRIKVSIAMADKQRIFYTFIPFSELVGSKFEYVLKIWVDDNSVPLAVSAKVGDWNTNVKSSTDDGYMRIMLKQSETGPQPDTASFIHKMEREREAKEKGANQDNRSFLAKYWIYILPLLIFAVLSGSVNADGSGTGGQR